MAKTPEEIADKIILIMSEAGLTPNQMLEIIIITKEKLEILTEKSSKPTMAEELGKLTDDE